MSGEASKTARGESEAGGEVASPGPTTSPPNAAGLDPRVHILFGLVAPMVLLAAAMWRLRHHTVDDAYISYRYAKNLARGLGLVFNEGERIEGYTNFLFTCLLAGAIKLGLDPDRAAKVIGAVSALGTVACAYGISSRVSPLRAVPVLSTWLLASSVVTAGYAVFGLETSLFVFLILFGTWLFLREREKPPGSLTKSIPWSGIVFAAAGLTRPEAPMFVGLLMLFLAAPTRGRLTARAYFQGLFGKQNLVRLVLFVVPVALHLAFRKSYYGAFLPNTFQAKTGNLTQQVHSGIDYLKKYAGHAGPFLTLALGGAALAIHRRSRVLGVFAAVAASVLVYIIAVGGDWMPQFRFVAPFEPFAFLLVDVFVRDMVETKRRPVLLALAIFSVYTAWDRGRAFTESARAVDEERIFWTSAAGGVADWFQKEKPPRGTIAVADMGYIAYATDYPILDLLGLVDPVISKLPGGYTHKTGAGYMDRVFAVMPRYFVFVGSADDCIRMPFPSQAQIRYSPRFRERYNVAAQIRHSKGGYWCIFASTKNNPN
ncbi:MAG: hypothetical protein IPK82_43160 [Polyangiaceae bacterium]|nr:hypothetical protein [Polyangiaceae bacterium]